MQPFEVVCAPYTLYVAPVGTAMPKIDAVPAGPWAPLGVSGDLSYSDKGITITNDQTVGSFTPAGGTTVRKQWRQAESSKMSLELADLSPASFAQALDVALNTVAANDTDAGYDEFEVYRGVQVVSHAVLARGISPVDESLSAQFQYPCAVQAGNLSIVLSKAGPALLAIEFEAIMITPGVLAQWVMQTAARL